MILRNFKSNPLDRTVPESHFVGVGLQTPVPGLGSLTCTQMATSSVCGPMSLDSVRKPDNNATANLKLIPRTKLPGHITHPIVLPTGSHLEQSDSCTYLSPALLFLSHRKHVTVPFLQYNLHVVVVSLSISTSMFIRLVSGLNLVDELIPLVSGRDSKENVIKFFKVWNACH